MLEGLHFSTPDCRWKVCILNSWLGFLVSSIFQLLVVLEGVAFFSSLMVGRCFCLSYNMGCNRRGTLLLVTRRFFCGSCFVLLSPLKLHRRIRTTFCRVDCDRWICWRAHYYAHADLAAWLSWLASDDD